MRTLVKTSAIIGLLFLYVLASFILLLLPAGRAGRRRLLTANVSLFARLVLASLGVRVVGRRKRRSIAAQNYLIVANHVSYVDILVIAALRPAVFITSVELKRSFPLGLFAWLGGSIFVERRNPSGLKEEIRDIEMVLRDGSPVVLFPEGTTSDGTTVKPFRNSLFTAAISTRTPVLPLCIRYRRANGRRLHDGNRDSVYYHGGTTFLEHSPRFLSLRSIHVECIELELVGICRGQTRKELAAACHEAIKAAYHPKK